MKLIKLFAALAIVLTAVFTACEKDDVSSSFEGTEQMAAAEDLVITEDFYTDAESQAEEAIETRGGDPDPDPTSTCPTVTVDPADGSYPRTITIDFGDGCEGPDGRIRKGQIVVTVSDTMINEGATRTITFVDYFVDEAQIEGTKTLTNLGFDADGNIAFHRTVIGGKVTFPNGKVVTREVDHTITQIAGANTPFFLDDVFEVTGNTSGVNRNGKAYSSEILEPVIHRKNCPFRVAGVLSLTVEDKTVSINYGNGFCDNKAILTTPDGNQHIVLIKRWW